MPKYEVTVDVNRVDSMGTQTYGVVASSPEDAVEKCFDTGELIREEFSLYWDDSYGKEPEPLVEEVDEFSYDHNIELEKKHKSREALFEKVLKEHVFSSELRDLYRQRWKDGCCE